MVAVRPLNEHLHLRHLILLFAVAIYLFALPVLTIRGGQRSHPNFLPGKVLKNHEASTGFCRKSANLCPPSAFEVARSSVELFGEASSSSTIIVPTVTSSRVVSLQTAEQLVLEDNSEITSLYVLPTCPFCDKVFDSVPSIHHKANEFGIHIKSIDGGDGETKSYADELKQLADGKQQVPALEIERRYVMFESSDIIKLLTAYFEKKQRADTEDTNSPNEISTENTIRIEDGEPSSLSNVASVSEVSKTYRNEEGEEIEQVTKSVEARYSVGELNKGSEQDASTKTKFESCTVFVGNVTWNANAEELEACMSLAGEVENISFVMNRFGKHKGCALVTYTTSEEAVMAIRTLDDSYFKGRKINVQAYRRYIKEPPSVSPGSEPQRFSNAYSRPYTTPSMGKFATNRDTTEAGRMIHEHPNNYGYPLYPTPNYPPNYIPPVPYYIAYEDVNPHYSNPHPALYPSQRQRHPFPVLQRPIPQRLNEDVSNSYGDRSNLYNNIVFVWNLPNYFSNDDLRELFSNSGPVWSSRLLRLTGDNTNRLGIIVYSTARAAGDALRRFNHFLVGDNAIEVTMSLPNPHYPETPPYGYMNRPQSQQYHGGERYINGHLPRPTTEAYNYKKGGYPRNTPTKTLSSSSFEGDEASHLSANNEGSNDSGDVMSASEQHGDTDDRTNEIE